MLLSMSPLLLSSLLSSLFDVMGIFSPTRQSSSRFNNNTDHFKSHTFLLISNNYSFWSCHTFKMSNCSWHNNLNYWLGWSENLCHFNLLGAAFCVFSSILTQLADMPVPLNWGVLIKRCPAFLCRSFVGRSGIPSTVQDRVVYRPQASL